MVRNPLSDGDPFSVAKLNSLSHAHAREGVISGCATSPGTGNFEVDVASGDIGVGVETVSVSSDTVTHSSPGAEDRVDLIVADNTGSLSITEGSVASTSGQPNAPDIPSNSVLLSLVYVTSDASELLSSDLFDEYRTEVIDLLPTGVIQMWSGAVGNVPSGWTLCDGTDGAPDLQDRFIVGAGNTYSPDDTGGADEVTLTEDEIPSHTHNVDAEPNTGGSGGNFNDGTLDANSIQSDSVGGDQAHENRPPYYALAYIMRV